MTKVMNRDFLFPVMFEVGDRIVTHGIRNVVDGTCGVVVGFGKVVYGRYNLYGIKPGIYVDHYMLKVQLDGYTVGPYLIKVNNLKAEDSKVAAIREVGRKMADITSAAEGIFLKKEYVGPLPKTVAYEHDHVQVWFRGPGKVFRVEYNKDPIEYIVVMDENEERVIVPEHSISLRKRGNVWKYEHGGILVFDSPIEEGNFFISIGEAVEVKNLNTGTYNWTAEDMFFSIRSGFADGFANDPTFGYIVYKYNDEDLGNRIADIVLTGHGLQARSEGSRSAKTELFT